MDKDIKIIKIYSEGNDGTCCHSKYIYNVPDKAYFTLPPKYEQFRICKKCGQIEIVETHENLGWNANKYTEIKKHFSK
jgi:hypothetical protein